MTKCLQLLAISVSKNWNKRFYNNMPFNVRTFKIGFHMQIIVVFLLKFRTTKTSNILEMLVGFQHKIASAKEKKKTQTPKPNKPKPPQIKVNFFEAHLSKGNLGIDSHSFYTCQKNLELWFNGALFLCNSQNKILYINEENQTSIPNVPLWSLNFYVSRCKISINGCHSSVANLLPYLPCCLFIFL